MISLLSITFFVRVSSFFSPSRLSPSSCTIKRTFREWVGLGRKDDSKDSRHDFFKLFLISFRGKYTSPSTHNKRQRASAIHCNYNIFQEKIKNERRENILEIFLFIRLIYQGHFFMFPWKLAELLAHSTHTKNLNPPPSCLNREKLLQLSRFPLLRPFDITTLLSENLNCTEDNGELHVTFEKQQQQQTMFD